MTGPVETALADLERRRRGRVLVVGLLVVAALATVALALVDDAAFGSLPVALVLLAVVTLAYGLWVLAEERRARRMVRSLIAERERASALAARVDAMETLHLVTRDLSASGELVEVFERLLGGASRLVGATAGVVALRAGTTGALTVAASTGRGAPPRGAVLDDDGSIASLAVEQGRSIVAGRGAPWGDRSGPPRIAAPLRLADRTVGVLVVERASEGADPAGVGPEATNDAEVAVVDLFAQHAALAVRNAWRLDEQRSLAAELQRAAARRAEVLAGIVHDLRAPLTAAGGFVTVLAEQEAALTPERRIALLGDVRGELERLGTIVEELLAVAAAEAGELRRSEVLDLALLVREVAQVGRGLLAARRAADAGGQGVGTLAVDAPGPAPVRGDGVALERVVTNLLENAVKHTPAGTPIEVAVRRGRGQVHLEVRDHGPTPPAELLEHAFDAFATAQPTAASGTAPATTGPDAPAAAQPTTPATRGRGIGLHVVRTLVEAHGGSVGLRGVPPDEGTGTVAEVQLPAAVLDADGPEPGQPGR